MERGLAICGSGVGSRFTALRVTGVRSALIHESVSAHKGVEDDDVNLLCTAGRLAGFALAWEIIHIYLAAHYARAGRFERHLEKVAAIVYKEQMKWTRTPYWN